MSDVGGVALRGVGRFHNHSLAGIGWRWWALVGAGGRATPAHPRKDGTSHQICSNGRFGSDLV
ncbi:hypothetical protein B1A65_03705 [Corynebacterium diphtheriae]|nr:hypothetical protein CDB402_0881 [Corynebacterium diphtheriae INCA 402]OSQ02313.1 hypothetical protein B1A65_03705 [Corynebacterium diphtheriae]